MIGRLSPGDRRTLALGAVAVVFLLGVARALPAWRAWDADARASALEMVAEAERAEAAVRAFPAALDSLEARRDRLVGVGSGVLEGGSPAAAGASLASRVSGEAARAGVQLGAVQLRADTASAGTFLRVGVRVDGTGDLPGILRLLEALEGGPELLVVRELSLTQPHAGGPAQTPEALRLEMTVEGLALAGDAGGAREEGAGGVAAAGPGAERALPAPPRRAPEEVDDEYDPRLEPPDDDYEEDDR